MPVIHLQINSPKQVVKIANHITSQDLKLFKATVTSRHSVAGQEGVSGNLEIHMGGLQGNEILSNVTAGRIPIPNLKHYVANTLITSDIDFDLTFAAESIPETFVVDVMGYSSIANMRNKNIITLPSDADGYFANNVGDGNPVTINLYFEYSSNHRFM